MARWPPLIWRVTMLTISAVVLILSVHGLSFQADFNGDLYLAGTRILHGVSPYDVKQLNNEVSAFTGHGFFHPTISPRWPAPILLASVPFALLPIKLAGVLFMLLSIAALIGALRMLGVRDSRCVLVALISAPAVNGIILGNISTLILFGAAAVWKLRSRHIRVAAATAAVFLAKLFLWPLGIWLLMTRGRRTLLIWVLTAVAAVAAGWMAIGFAGLAQYPKMILDIAKIGEPRGCSMVAFMLFLGFHTAVARVISFAAAFSLLFLAWKLSRNPETQANAFGLVIIAALTATPVVWDHYMVLLFVPIALLSPRLSWLWFLPTLAAFAPAAATVSYGWWTLPILSGELVLVLALCQPLLRQPARRYWRSIVAIASAAIPS